MSGNSSLSQEDIDNIFNKLNGKNALLIKPEDIEISDKNYISYDNSDEDIQFAMNFLYSNIECEMFQMVHITSGTHAGKIDIYLDECGKLEHKPVNYLATKIYNNPRDALVGNVLFFKKGTMK